MLSRIHATEGYSPDKKLAIAGNVIKDTSFRNMVSETSGAQYHGNYNLHQHILLEEPVEAQFCLRSAPGHPDRDGRGDQPQEVEDMP